MTGSDAPQELGPVSVPGKFREIDSLVDRMEALDAGRGVPLNPLHKYASEVAEGSRLLCFIHVAKCGGTTLGKIFRGLPNVRLLQPFGPADVVSGLGLYDLRSTAAKLVQEVPLEDGKCSVFSGHIPYGLEEFVREPILNLVLLRDPFDRTLSAFHFDIDMGNPLETDIEKFLRSSMAGLDNYQTRVLSGDPTLDPQGERPRCPPARFANAEDGRLARVHLRLHNTLVGVMSEFDAFLCVLSHLFGWAPEDLFYARANVGKSRAERSVADLTGLAPNVREVMQERNQLDSRLYRCAEETFARTKASLSVPIAEKARLFSDANSVWRDLTSNEQKQYSRYRRAERAAKWR